jgi:hypothetical protein
MIWSVGYRRSKICLAKSRPVDFPTELVCSFSQECIISDANQKGEAQKFFAPQLKGLGGWCDRPVACVAVGT